MSEAFQRVSTKTSIPYQQPSPTRSGFESGGDLYVLRSSRNDVLIRFQYFAEGPYFRIYTPPRGTPQGDPQRVAEAVVAWGEAMQASAATKTQRAPSRRLAAAAVGAGYEDALREAMRDPTGLSEWTRRRFEKMAAALGEAEVAGRSRKKSCAP